jgi:Tol biopolymer transport system component
MPSSGSARSRHIRRRTAAVVASHAPGSSRCRCGGHGGRPSRRAGARYRQSPPRSDPRQPPSARATREAAWSPDGRKILYVSRGRNTWDLYVINVDGSGQRMLTSVLSASAAWSPDGRKIAFRGRRKPDASRGLRVINADGSGKRRLARKGRDPAWSPDGRTIAFADSATIYVVNADGTGQRGLADKTVAASRTGGACPPLRGRPTGGGFSS